jgi:hypothetical protein
MENKKDSILLVLSGMDGRAWEIDYFSIIDYEESGDDTLLTLNDHLNNGASRLLVQITKPGFELIYNEVKSFVVELQKIIFEALDDIQKSHNYFQRTGTNIQEYLSIHWTNPVKIKFSSEKELPVDIKNEIQEKFRVME